MPFQALEDRPQWRIIYDHLRTLEVDDVITDEKLHELLPHAPWGSVMGAFRRAVQELENINQRTFDRVRGVGYRQVHAREHAVIANRYQKRAGRTMKTAHRKARSADRKRLTPDERRQMDDLQAHLAVQADMLRRLADRHQRLDDRVAVEEKISAVVDTRLERLEEALRRNNMID